MRKQACNLAFRAGETKDRCPRESGREKGRIDGRRDQASGSEEKTRTESGMGARRR